MLPSSVTRIMNILDAPIQDPTPPNIFQIYNTHLNFRSYTTPSIRETSNNRMISLTMHMDLDSFFPFDASYH